MTCDGIAPPPIVSSWTKDTAQRWCERIVEKVGMNAIYGPYAKEHDGLIIGFCVIAESHIAVHLNPTTGECYAECFSCRPFDQLAFIQETLDAFGILDTGVVAWRQRSVER